MQQLTVSDNPELQNLFGTLQNICTDVYGPEAMGLLVKLLMSEKEFDPKEAADEFVEKALPYVTLFTVVGILAELLREQEKKAE